MEEINEIIPPKLEEGHYICPICESLLFMVRNFDTLHGSRDFYCDKCDYEFED